MVYSFSCFFVCHNLGFRGASCVFMYWSNDWYSSCSTKIRSAAGRSQMWVIHSGELTKLVLVAILRSHLCKKYYYHRHYEHEVATLNEFVRPTLSLKSQNILLLLQACWLHKSLYIQILMKGYQLVAELGFDFRGGKIYN